MEPTAFSQSVSIFKGESTTKDASSVPILDKEWIKNVFLVSDQDLDEEDRVYRYLSTANVKFTDSSLGGSLAVNSPPQFTRYADIRVRGRLSKRQRVTLASETNLGQGSMYSEKIDDNLLKLYLEFGVPEFNNIFTFFTRAIDYKASVIATTGRNPLAYDVGKAGGTIVAFLAFPLITSAVTLLKSAWEQLMGDQPLNYYYFKPNMHTYWSTVSGIVTSFATELGIILPYLNETKLIDGKLGMQLSVDAADIEELNRIMPNIVHKDGYVDVLAIVNKTQYLANQQRIQEYEYYKKHKDNIDDSYEGFLALQTSPVMEGKTPGLSDFINKILSVGDYGEYFEPDNTTEGSSLSNSENATTVEESLKTSKVTSPTDKDGKYDMPDEDTKTKQHSWRDYFDTSFREGGAYAILAVDKVGSVTESFSNSVTDIPTGGALKSITHGIKQAEFNFAGGNILGSAAKEVFGYAKDLAAGSLHGMTLGLSNVVMSMLGGAYVDIPKMWDDSSASFPTITYTIKLRSPYAHPISQLKHLYLPIAMLLAGTLPLSAGRSAYVSPFLCRSFLKGIQDIQLGMITDLSITRATTNLPYSKSMRPLGFDVSFTITDFSNIMTAPVDKSLFAGINNTLDDGSMISRYIKTVTGRDLLTNKYVMKRLKLRLSRLVYAYDNATSASFWGYRAGQLAMESPLGGLVAGHAINITEINN